MESAVLCGCKKRADAFLGCIIKNIVMNQLSAISFFKHYTQRRTQANYNEFRQEKW